MKILLIDHEFSCKLGSECYSAFKIAEGLAKRHDITVIYAQTNQLATNNYVSHNKDVLHAKNIKSFAIPQPKKYKWLINLNKALFKKSNIGNRFIYFFVLKNWEKNVVKFIKMNDMELDYDLIHHINHITFREPSYLYKQSIPYVLGPKSGTDYVISSYLGNFARVKTIIRNLLIKSHIIWNFRIKKSARKAAFIFAVTKSDLNFYGRLNANVEQMLDVGIDSELSNEDHLPNTSIKKRFLWVGRIDELKKLELLIKAVISLNKSVNQFEVTVIGDGPLKEKMKQLCFDNKVSNIFFIGKVSHDQVSAYMKNSDFLIHTSIKEASSAVILEAISNNLPVICHDAFGMSKLIADDLALPIVYESERKSIELIAKYLIDISVGKIEQDNLSYQKIYSYTWDSKIARISEVYALILNKGN